MRKWMMVALAVASSGAALAQDVTLRHDFTGAARDELATLVERFNQEQKGKGRIVLEDLAGVTDRRHLPQLALLDEDDARLFFDTVPRFRPIADVMKEGGQPFDAGQFFPQVAGAVDDLRGRLQGLPMALGLPVLFYNKEAFAKAGLDPASPPRTWQDVQTAAGALADAGVACPLTTSRFAWVHVENLASQHGEPATAKGGRPAFNDLVHVKHLARLASWQKSRYFHYFGPGREGDAKFLSGECAMLTGESALHGDLKAAKFAIGIGPLPYYDDVRGAQAGNVLPDGAALWALPAKKNETQVAARFIAFLMQPRVQRDWVRATGFLPMTPTALDELAAAGVSPVLVEAARKRLGVPNAADARLHSGPSRSRVRALLDEEIGPVWTSDRPAKEALDKAVQRAGAPAH